MPNQVQHDANDANSYIRSMPVWLGLILFVGTIVAMELVAYAAHRWIMHGPGWFLHKSHHLARTGPFEANDWYAAIFAIPSILLFLWGIGLGHGALYAWIGGGIAAYGAIYFGFHDVIVHKRIGHRYVPRSSYMKRIVQAHRLHHATDTRHGSVSYGFLWAPPAETLKAELARRGREGLRSPVR